MNKVFKFYQFLSFPLLFEKKKKKICLGIACYCYNTTMVFPKLLLQSYITYIIMVLHTAYIYNITDTKRFNKIDTNLLVTEFLLYAENV